MMKRTSIRYLRQLKQQQEKIACLTAYDAAFAAQLENAAIDVILVGDSLGMVVQGQETTVPVSMDDMLYHAALVARGAPNTLRIVDLPFGACRDVATAVDNGIRFLQKAGAHMVKLEGGRQVLPMVEALVANSVPVCAHLGLLPQSVIKLGGYRVQGREQEQAQRLLDDARALDQAGVDALVLECVPAALARQISAEISAPVIGIGAGADCDGQVLVLYDAIGIAPGHSPKFSKNFLTGQASIAAAIEAYIQAVKQGQFPGPEQSMA